MWNFCLTDLWDQRDTRLIATQHSGIVPLHSSAGPFLPPNHLALTPNHLVGFSQDHKAEHLGNIDCNSSDETLPS